MKNKEKQRKDAGITLVALVVTIIILIILATISLNAVLGEDGLIAKAKLAKLEYRGATVEEEVIMWKAEKEFAKYVGEMATQPRNEFIEDQRTRGLLTNDEADEATTTGQVQIGSRFIDYGEDDPPPKTKNEIAEQYDIEQPTDKTVHDDSENPKGLTIPAGFTVVNPAEDDTIQYEDPDNPKVDEGIVVKDGVGNQFVWVPVDDINKIAMCQQHQTGSTITYHEDTETFTCSGDGAEEVKLAGKLYDFVAGQSAYATEKVKAYAENTGYREPDIVTGDAEGTGTEYDGATSNLDKIQQGLTRDDFKNQLQTEFNNMVKSVAQYKGFYIGRYETSELGTNSPKVQKDKEPTVRIDWYTMYKNSKEVAKGSSSVTSSMIWGCQWDAVMNWFISLGGDKATYVTKSTGKGNYKPEEGTGTKKNTGSELAYEVNNIYDMAGNVYEWTLTSNHTDERVLRGGSYVNYVSVYPASVRDRLGPTYTNDYLGSRATLYVNLNADEGNP